MKSIKLFIAAISIAVFSTNMPGDTIAYWQMEDGITGRTAPAGSLLKTRKNSPALNAKVNKNEKLTIKFSSDVPGKETVSGKDQKVVNKKNRASVQVVGKANNIPAFTVSGNKLFNQENFTVEAFVKLSEIPKWTRIICKKRAKNHFSWILSCEDTCGKLRGRVDSNKLDATDKTGFNQGMPTKTLIVDGKWHHIAATYDGETRKFYIYIDYEVKSRAVIPFPMIYDDKPLCFFATTFPGKIIAQIDEVRLSNKAMLPEDFLKIKK